jgi:hypothetical protein
MAMPAAVVPAGESWLGCAALGERRYRITQSPSCKLHLHFANAFPASD